MQTICVGDLLQKEITMHSKYGDVIQKCRKNYGYIPDEIVIDLVTQNIEKCEKEPEPDDAHSAGWILEGFPRTRMQALALQRMKVRPDKFFMINYPDVTSKENLK